jgi:hypothetical protein
VAPCSADLVGINIFGGTISNSYATGNVSVGSYSGGLVGFNYGGSINYSYETGRVSAGTSNGGLIGANIDGGTISDSYWNSTANPTLPGVGGGSPIGTKGLSTTQMHTAASFGGFAFTATPGAGGNNWVIVDSDGTLNNAAAVPGATFPMLSSEYSTTISNAHQLQLIAMAQGANYTLAADIDASATALATTSGSGDIWSTLGGFVPIANFSGSFDGQNHTINNLSINLVEPNVGLFALTSGAAVIRNVGLVGGSVTGGAGTGELVGNNGPGNPVINSYATGAVSGAAGTGGLIGSNTTGSVSGSYATGSVTGAAGTGGLIGSNTTGAVSDSYATGNVVGAAGTGGLIGSNTSAAISTSYATGSVTGAAGTGGLIGSSTSGPISNSYATGNVNGGAGAGVGGLIGSNTSGTVTNTYSAGSVSGTGAGIGALLGSSDAGVVTASYWDSTKSIVQNSAGGGVGMTTAQMMTQANFVSSTTANGLSNPTWDFSNIWTMFEGLTYPLLSSYMSTLTVTANDASRVYGQPNPAFSVSYSSIPTADLLGTVSYGGPAQTAVNVGTYAIAPSGLYSNQQGYIISYANGALNITAASLTVSGESAANKVYDGTFTAALAGGTLIGVVGGDTVSLTQTGTFNTKDVANNIPVTATDTLTGSSAANYTLVEPLGLSANITAASLTVSGESAANKVYDGTFTAALAGGTLIGVVGGDTVSLTQTGTFNTKDVANNIPVTATDTLTGSSAANYTLVEPLGLSANITAASLTVSGESAANKVYDGTFTAALAGGTLIGVVGGDTVSLTQTGTFNTKDVANNIPVTATDTLTGSSAANYTLVEPLGLSANITAASLTVSGESAANKVYDGTFTAALAGGTLIGVVGGDTVSLTQTGTFNTKDVANNIPVTATDTLTGSSAANYTLVEPLGLSANITAASLTVSGESAANKVYDGTFTAALAGGTLIGVVGGDTVSLTQTGTFNTKDVANNIPVTATDTLTGSSAANYTLVEPLGLSANITAASLTVSGESAANKVYDGTFTAALAGGTLIGVVGGDTVSLTQTGTFNTKDVANNIPVTATDTLTGSSAANYTLVEPLGLSANITAASLTVSGESAANKVYDGTFTAALAGGTLIGVVGGDTVSLTQTGTFNTKDVANNIPVTATDTLTGSSAANYTLVEPLGLSANITAASLTVSGESAANKVYDGTFTAALAGGTLIGVVGGDTVSLTQTGTFNTKDVANNIPVTATDTLTGSSAANYTLVEPLGLSANITAASLTVSGESAANKVYDGTFTAALAGGTLIGVVGGDTVSLTQTGTFNTKDVANNIPVTATDTLTGSSAANYTLVEPLGLSANITAASLTYIATSASFTAGQTPSGLTGAIVGFMAGDTQFNATTGSLAWTTTAGASSEPGRYAIDGSGLTATNYVFVDAAADATALTLLRPTSPPSGPTAPSGAATTAQNAVTSIEANSSSAQTNIQLAMLDLSTDVVVAESMDVDTDAAIEPTDGIVVDRRKAQHGAMVPSLRIFRGGVKLPIERADIYLR